MALKKKKKKGSGIILKWHLPNVSNTYPISVLAGVNSQLILIL